MYRRVSSAVLSETAETAPTQRDKHLQLIVERGRMLELGRPESVRSA